MAISKEARTVAAFLRRSGTRKTVAKQIINPKRSAKDGLPPKRMHRRYRIDTVTVQECDCLVFRRKESLADPTHLIFYFHGGAYSLAADPVHWRLTDRLLTEIDCTLVFVNYPLSPEHFCSETVEAAVSVYRHFSGDTVNTVSLMGDSAGGGLALALAQQIRDFGIFPQPDSLALLSPWLDVSMETAGTAGNPEDHLLDAQVLETVGKRYAGDLSVQDPRCSPLYGSLHNLGCIALFSGTYDLLNPDSKALADKAAADGAELTYFEYPEMQHFWMGFPIPEAADALSKLCAFINETI